MHLVLAVISSQASLALARWITLGLVDSLVSPVIHGHGVSG